MVWTVRLIVLAVLAWPTSPLFSQAPPLKLYQPVPQIRLEPWTPLSDAETARIRHLIADLAKADLSFGAVFRPDGPAFVPVVGADKRCAQESSPFDELVELGPRAIPVLLESLDDKTPTGLSKTYANGGSFGDCPPWPKLNPFNPREAKLAPLLQRATHVKPDSSDQWSQTWHFRVGDICLGALGQIVGRDYYMHDRFGIRELWRSGHPAQELIDSLLIDYSSDGGEYRDLPNAAARRLLYYFPRQTAGMLAAGLDRLKVNAGGAVERDAANGIDACSFIEALAWSKNPITVTALVRLATRTNDPALFIAALPAVNEADHALACHGLESFLRKRSAGDVTDADLLIALARIDADAARPVFNAYLKDASVKRCLTICHVFEATRSPWMIRFLYPFLGDQRPISPNDKANTRVCDQVARMLAKSMPELELRPMPSDKDPDKYISRLQKRIAWCREHKLSGYEF